MAGEELTRIENLKRKMYSRQTEGLRGIKEHRLYPSDDLVKRVWEEEKEPMYDKKRKPILKWFLFGSLFFFAVAIAYVAYLYFGGSNEVSSRNIGIEIAGPVSIKGAEKISLEINVENRNATPLEVVDLLVEYPDGTRDAGDISKELLRTREGLGDIKSGGRVSKTVSAILFGEEREVKTIKVTVEYRVPDSNAILYKESEYQVTISSSPISLRVEVPKEANSGQDMALKVTITSNSSDVIQGIILKGEYPSGFSFKSAEPTAYAEDRIWKIGDMKPESTRTIIIRGVLSGENLDTRVFHFDIGVASSKDDKVISTPFTSIVEEVAIKKPFVGLSLAVNGSSDEVISSRSGKPVRVDITYTNNLLVPVSNVEISLGIDGNALDKSSVSVESGFYRSVDNTVIWDQSTKNQSLALIPPGGKGTVNVTLSSMSISQGINSFKNPQITLTTSVKGKRVEGGGVPETIIASLKRVIKIQSDVTLNSRLLYYSGPLKNIGPMPPRADKETTYNVVWSITNGSNDLGDVIVTAQLPSYVRFVGTASDGAVSYNNVGGIVTWNSGVIKSQTGFGSPPKEVAFQIAFTPSVSQIGSTPTLLTGATLSALDKFTNSNVSIANQGLTTRLVSDSGAKQGDDVVVK